MYGDLKSLVVTFKLLYEAIKNILQFYDLYEILDYYMLFLRVLVIICCIYI